MSKDTQSTNRGFARNHRGLTPTELELVSGGDDGKGPQLPTGLKDGGGVDNMSRTDRI